jgi:hypothetical protein
VVLSYPAVIAIVCKGDGSALRQHDLCDVVIRIVGIGSVAVALYPARFFLFISTF